MLGDSYIYRLDYGDPLDGHGFIQKIILEEGYVGLILFVSFLIWNILLLYKYRRDRYVSIMLLTVVGAVVFQLFNTSYFNSVMWLPLGVASASVLQARKIYE